MRVAPVALFCHNNVDALIETARKSALITHAHREGYNGAVLQVRCHSKAEWKGEAHGVPTVRRFVHVRIALLAASVSWNGNAQKEGECFILLELGISVLNISTKRLVACFL